MVQGTRDGNSRHIPDTEQLLPCECPEHVGHVFARCHPSPGDPMSQLFKKRSRTPLGAVCPFQHGLYDSFRPPNWHPFSLSPCKRGSFALTDHGSARCPRRGLSALFLSRLFLMPQYLSDGLSRERAKAAPLTGQYGTIGMKIQDAGRKNTLEATPRNQGWVSPQQSALPTVTPHRHGKLLHSWGDAGI